MQPLPDADTPERFFPDDVAPDIHIESANGKGMQGQPDLHPNMDIS